MDLFSDIQKLIIINYLTDKDGYKSYVKTLKLKKNKSLNELVVDSIILSSNYKLSK